MKFNRDIRTLQKKETELQLAIGTINQCIFDKESIKFEL